MVSLLRSLLVLMLLLPVPAALAQEALFSSDVSVDISAESAAAARDAAMQQAERQGLEELLDRLAPEQKEAIITKMDANKISAMVKSMEVLDEKISGTRYRALMRVSYDALQVNQLLDTQVAAANSDEVSAYTSTLVLPLFESGGKLMLWDADNPWKSAWSGAMLEMSGGGILIPYGDKLDKDIITAARVESATPDSLMQLRRRYGVNGVIMVKASLQRSPSLVLNVVRRTITDTQGDAILLEYRADAQEDTQALLHRAALDIGRQIERMRDDMFSAQAMGGSAEDRIMVLVPLTTLDSWLRVRDTLLKMQVVKKVDILALSPQQVDIMVHYRGVKDILARDLQNAGLRVISADNYLIVSKE